MLEVPREILIPRREQKTVQQKPVEEKMVEQKTAHSF
jgi:hypothetical protein